MPSRSVGSLAPFAWRMNVRRMPSVPPNRPASKTTLSRGEASPGAVASPGLLVQSSCAKTNAAKSTSRVSSTSRSSVGDTGVEDGGPRFDLRDLRESARQRLHQLRLVSDEPRRMRGFIPVEIRDSLRGSPRRSTAAKTHCRSCSRPVLAPVLHTWGRARRGSHSALARPAGAGVVLTNIPIVGRLEANSESRSA